MLRGITRFFIAIILFFTTIAVVLAGVIALRLLDANVYKTALQDVNAYSTVSQQAQDSIYTLVNGYQVDNLEMTLVIQKAITDELKVQLPNYLGASAIKDIVEKNIDNVGNYLNSYTDVLYVYLPKTDFQSVIINAAVSIGNRIDDEIKSLPVCNGPQPAKTIDDLACVTAALKQSGGNKSFLDGLVPPNVQQPSLDQTVPLNLQLLQGDDQQPIDTYIQALGGTNNANVTQMLTTISQIRGLVSTLKLLLLIGIVLVIFLFVLYAALKKGGLLSKIKSGLKMVFFIAMAITGIAGLGLLVGTLFLSSQGLTFEGLGSIGTLIPALAKDVIGQVLIPTLIVAAVVAFISFVLWLIAHAISSAIKTVD